MTVETDSDLFGPDATESTLQVASDLSKRPVRASLSASLMDAAREQMRGLEKFVLGAVVAPQGKAEAAGYMPLVRRMAAVGLVSSFAILVPDGEAQAWGRPVGTGYNQSSIGAGFQAYRERRREIRQERNQQFLAAGAGLVGGLLLGGALTNNNNNYRPYPVQPSYGAYGGGYGGGYGGYQPRPVVVPQNYGGYGGGYGGGYNRGPIAPSNDFVLGAKSLIAARVGSTIEADRIYDRFQRQAANCVLQLGPSDQCIARFQGVSLDISRGEFLAADSGVTVLAERNGRLNVLRPDMMQMAQQRAAEVAPGRGYGY